MVIRKIDDHIAIRSIYIQYMRQQQQRQQHNNNNNNVKTINPLLKD
jgi:hypothetical protein